MTTTREPFNPGKPTFDELVEASSLGTPEAVALRRQGRALLEATEPVAPAQVVPTRADLARAVILWEAIAKEAKDQAAANRQVLDEQARVEYETSGGAPTWRIPDVGTVPLALTSASVQVVDEQAYVAWVAQRYPTEVQETVTVRSGFDTRLRGLLAEQGDDTAADPESGEVIPGLRYVPGGQPRGVSVRASPRAKEAVRAQARYLLGLPDPESAA